MFNKKYTVSSKEWPDAKLKDLVVDRYGHKYVTIELPDKELVDVQWYKITRITYGGWLMRFIYNRAKRQLPDLRQRFYERMKPLSGGVKHAIELRREMKLKRSKKRAQLYLQREFSKHNPNKIKQHG